MAIKRCSKCGIDKPIDNFARKGTGRRSDCKSCFAVYISKYYQSHKDAFKKAALKRNKITEAIGRAILREAKAKPCMDCGVSYPYYVMDLDHQRDKIMNVSGFIRSKNIPALKLEIAKCEVVCANCHRERTHGETNDNTST